MDNDFVEFPEFGFFQTLKPIAFAVIVGILFGIRAHFRGSKYYGKIKLKDKTAIVTGASHGGMGYEIAKDFISRGARVIVTCRTAEEARKVAADLHVATASLAVIGMELNLSSFESIRSFVDNFITREPRLDILVNNAGIMMCPQTETVDGFEAQFQINYLSPLLLTELLLDRLRMSRPSRVVNVVASAYSMGKLDLDDVNFKTREYNSGDAYMQSKLALVLASRKLAESLIVFSCPATDVGVTVNCVHPGVVRTRIHRHMPFQTNAFLRYSLLPFTYFLMKDPLHGAQTTIYAAVAPELEQLTGRYFAEQNEELYAPVALDDEKADELYARSLVWLGLTDPETGKRL